MNLTRVGEELVQVADLHGYVDNVSAKKTIQECAVSLCKLSNHLEGQSCSWIWQVTTLEGIIGLIRSVLYVLESCQLSEMAYAKDIRSPVEKCRCISS